MNFALESSKRVLVIAVCRPQMHAYRAVHIRNHPQPHVAGEGTVAIGLVPPRPCTTYCRGRLQELLDICPERGPVVAIDAMAVLYGYRRWCRGRLSSRLQLVEHG